MIMLVLKIINEVLLQMNKAKELVRQALDELHEAADKIYAEWIIRYCEDKQGNMLICYSKAEELAKEAGEIILVRQYEQLWRQIKALENVLSGEFVQ